MGKPLLRECYQHSIDIISIAFLQYGDKRKAREIGLSTR
nr:MAG TPA: hypothetical protein [Caudoviricetes sp.]